MKRKGFIIIIVTLICSIIALTIICIWGATDDFSDKFGVVLSVASMVVSAAALIYAMVTYYTIDRVQANSSVEGDILCNEKYSVAYPESISYFEKCTSAADFCEKLFDLLLYYLLFGLMLFLD